MGQLHNELRRGGLSAALTKALGDTKGEGGLERYGETLTPIMNLWGLPEWAFLRNEALCGDGRAIAAGGATTFGQYAVVNPTGSRMIVVVEFFTVTIEAIAEIRVGMDTEGAIAAALGAAGVGVFKDTRWARIAGNPRARIYAGSSAVSLGTIWYDARVPISVPVDVVAGVVLHPGFGCVVRNTDDNATLQASAQWRERTAAPGELV